jgi:allantoicase
MTEAKANFTLLPDLASRQLRGSVISANDEFFAEKENLIKPDPPAFAAADFGNKGKVYDGWETRRRREPGHDWAIVRLGCQGIVHGVVVDTAFFRGNYPPEISVEAANVEGYPSPAEVADLRWHQLIARASARGDAANSYEVIDRRRWTHVRLSIYPDGGVARFRVHGEVVPDPAFLTGTIDLAALENGGRVVGCSNSFYSSPEHLIMPGRAHVMSDGWENARRRDNQGDYVTIKLAARGLITHTEIDTSYFLGNAPGWINLSAADDPEVADADLSWRELLPRTRVQPDTRHRFRIDDTTPTTHIRLDVIPDGGLARLRVHGQLTAEALSAATDRWHATAP